jgi:16S rRNA (cytosine967-C5)-methyltransferase
MVAPARVAAYDILLAVARGRSDLPSAVAAARARLHDERDRALAAEIATGVQRWRAALDHVIAAVAKRGLDRLDPEVVEILRLSAYQLLHLTRVPAAAVVDEAVKLARRAGKASAAGFVNAVLRTISRKRRTLPLPPRPQESAPREALLDYLSISLSHPRWLARRWLDRYGFTAAEQWMRFDNTAAPLTLRANTLKTNREELLRALEARDVHARPGRFAPDAVILETDSRDRSRQRSAQRTAGIDESWFVVQDEAAQLIPLLTGARPGMRILDPCASPGGKATAVAAMMRGSGLLVASDLRDRRMRLLRRTISVAGASNVRLVRADALAPLPFRQAFDVVVLDAPCSGLGTLRRDPDIRWRRREDDLPALAAAELTMLQHAAEAVAAGGRLVYATCSSEPDENDGVAAAFLATTPTFALVDARQAAPELPAEVVDERGFLRTEPHRHQLEAFFAAVFVRTGPAAANSRRIL